MLTLADEFGREVGQGRVVIQYKVSQSDLAAMAGIARENVSRVLNDWANRSLVRRLAGYYCLENKAALQREAEERGGVHQLAFLISWPTISCHTEHRSAEERF